MNFILYVFLMFIVFLFFVINFVIFFLNGILIFVFFVCKFSFMVEIFVILNNLDIRYRLFLDFCIKNKLFRLFFVKIFIFFRILWYNILIFNLVVMFLISFIKILFFDMLSNWFLFLDVLIWILMIFYWLFY